MIVCSIGLDQSDSLFIIHLRISSTNHSHVPVVAGSKNASLVQIVIIFTPCVSRIVRNSRNAS